MKWAGLAGILTLILISCLFLFLSFGSVKLSDKDNGDLAILKCGQKLDIILSGNPTTGYNWERFFGDEKVIRQKGDIEFCPDTKAIGSPGKVKMHFIATGKGSTDLKLIYRRPWEKALPPAKRYHIKILVK